MMRFVSKSVLFLFWAILSNVSLFAQSEIPGLPCDVSDPLISIDPLEEWWAEQDPCCGQYIRHDVCYNVGNLFQGSSFIAPSCEVRLLRFEMPADTFTGSIVVLTIEALAQQMNTLLINAGTPQLAGFTASYPLICADSLTEGNWGELVLVCGNDTTRVRPTINTYDTCPLTIDQMRSAYEGMINGDPFADLPLFQLPPDGTTPGSTVTTSQMLAGSSWNVPPGANASHLPSDIELGHALNMLFGSGLLTAGVNCSGVNFNCMLANLIQMNGTSPDDEDWILTDVMDEGGLSEGDRQEVLDGLQQWSNSLETQGGLAGFLNTTFGWNFPNIPCPDAAGNLRGTGRAGEQDAMYRAKSMMPDRARTEADADYFSKEIPGIGAGTMSPPTPSALAAIQAISGGVNLYNGAQSTSIPLHTLQAYDISVPVGISSSNNGLKVDDIPGSAGQHWSIQAGGEITRVVKGLPDEFNGTIQGIGVGQQVRYTPRIEIPSTFGVHVKPLTGDIFTIPDKQFVWVGFQRELSEVIGYNNDLRGPTGDRAPIKLIFNWAPFTPEKITIKVRIPIFTFAGNVVSLDLGFDAGFSKSAFLTPIEYQEKAIGYQHIDNATAMSSIGLPALEENILPANNDDKLKVLKAIHPGRKLDDLAVVSELAGSWAALRATIQQFANGRVIHKTDRIDVQPDEYHFTAGGYSGKFFIKPNGQVLLTPYQPDVVVTPVWVNGELVNFTVRTPDGFIYTYGQDGEDENIDYSQDMNYYLPNMYAYPEQGTTRDTFKRAKVDVSIMERYPLLGRLSLKPYGNTYDRNYKITNAPRYASAWKLVNIQSIKTQERVTFKYDNRTDLKFYSNKSYSHTFPDFSLMEGPLGRTDYRDQHNPVHRKSTRWENGRADFTYTATQTTQNRWDLKSIISAARGERVDFLYEESKGEIVGDKVCTEIRVSRGVGDEIRLYRGWRLYYNYPTAFKPDDVKFALCDENTSSTDGGSAPISINMETTFKMDSIYQPEMEDFHNYLMFQFGLGNITIPLRFRFPFRRTWGTIPYRNQVSELGSLLEVRAMANKYDQQMHAVFGWVQTIPWLPFDANQQLDIFKAEAKRTFLYSIKEIDQNEDRHPFVEMEYENAGALPKRFSVHQDAYGYHTDNRQSGSPFPAQNYQSMFTQAVSDSDSKRIIHYGFYNKESMSSQIYLGRAKPNLQRAKTGSLRALTMASGAVISYEYELNQLTASESLGAGLRVSKKTENPGDTPAKVTEYDYANPSANTLPVFVSQNSKDIYYQNDILGFGNPIPIERKIVSTSYPQNMMLPNGGNITGYGQVTETWPGTGKVVHHFTTPDNFLSQIEFPSDAGSYSFPVLYNCYKNVRNNILEPGDLEVLNPCLIDNAAHSPSVFVPDVLRQLDIFFGREIKTETYSDDIGLAVLHTNQYKLADNKGRVTPIPSIRMFNSSMYQLNHYGTFWSVFVRNQIRNYFPYNAFEEGVGQFIQTLIGFIFQNTPLSGRYVQRHFETSMYEYPALNIVLKSSSTTENFSGGSSTTETTDYSYLPTDAYYPDIRGTELLLDAQTTSYSDGNSVFTKYHYPFQTGAAPPPVGSPLVDVFYVYRDANGNPTEEATINYLNTNGYRQPIATQTLVNGTAIEANVTALTMDGNKIAPKANYGLQNGDFVLLGKFSLYNADAKPTRYELAQFGTTLTNNEPFFDPITLTWDEHLGLPLKQRTYLDFTTIHSFPGPFFQYHGTTDNNGVSTSIAYDARGRVASVSKLNGHELTSYQYLIGPGANAIVMKTHYRTGEDMDLTQYLDGLGKETKLVRLNDGAKLNEKTYDSFWRVRMEYNIGSKYTHFKYENSPLSKLLESSDAEENKTAYQYFGLRGPDPEDNDGITTYTGTALTDPNGHTSESHYNSLGKIRKTVAGLSNAQPPTEPAKVIYNYDPLQRLVEMVNPIGELFTYDYNAMGLVWRTTVPARGPQSVWYDHKFRPVATQDGNGQLVINQYDNQDRIWKSFLHETGSVSGSGINNSGLSSFHVDAKRLSELTYTPDPGSTWVEQSDNRLLRDPNNQPPDMVRSVHALDDIGRATQSIVTYPDATLTQNTVYSSAGFVKRSTRDVQHASGATQRIVDIFTHDNVLRPEKHRIQYGPNEYTDFVMANHLVYDDEDRLVKKFVGTAPGNETRFLQEVNYAYDRISRLLRINDPGTFGCNIGEEVCELSLELKLSKATLAAGHCRRLEAIKVDNLTYTLPSPLSLTGTGQAPAITAAIQQALDFFGLEGTAQEVLVREVGDYFIFTFAVSGTQARSMGLVLESCDQAPAFSSDCCIIAPIPDAVVGEGSGLPFSTCADLYHQRMRYNGLDIANITLGSTCDARMVNNYRYDALHRITAMHNSLIRPGLAAEDAYSTSYSYDRAGNIQRLTRRGFVGMSGNAPMYDLIDDLHYTYAGANPGANVFSSKLQGVNDVVTDAAAQPRGVVLPSSGYTPDGNGNLRIAGSVSADYNILNLPKSLTTPSGTRRFGYVYGGGKYSAQLITGNPAIDETRHYVGGMEFKDGILEAYNFGDGRVVFHDSVPTLRFQYRLHDHLGNTVVFFEDKNNDGCIKTEDQATSQADLEIIQRLLYYPFGMALEGLGAWSAQPWQQYRYNGKERDTLTGWYEYGFRWYIDGIGRFTGVDPIADQFAWVSVYNYAENSPIGNIDLHGLQAAGYEIATRRDDIALMKGQMSRDEYVARQQARGQGAIAGMGLGILFVGGKAALVGAGQWVLRNPVAATEMAKTAGGVIWGMTTEQEMPGNLDNTGRVMKAGAKAAVQEIGTLRNFDQVAGYVRKNRKLPSNFITKEEATSLGWKPKLGNLDAVAPGKSIGGDIFKNKEGLLPEKSGRVWYEADINYTGGFRSSDRLLYSNDGLLYKTTDHYKTFEPIKTK